MPFCCKSNGQHLAFIFPDPPAPLDKAYPTLPDERHLFLVLLPLCWRPLLGLPCWFSVASSNTHIYLCICLFSTSRP